MRLRAEVLRFVREDGGVDLLDPLQERLISLSASDARALDAGEPELMSRLHGHLLCEGEMAESLRQSAWASRVRGRPKAEAAASRPPFDWTAVAELPAIVAPAWRDAERFRRLAEDAAAGRRYLPLAGFVDPGAAAALAASASELPFQRMDTPLVHAERRLLAGDELAPFRELMASPAVRALFAAVLGRSELPDKLTINAWRFRGDDYLGVHPDGRLYQGTFSLGLCASWTAADGGAIAFGDPTPAGFAVRERWLPHLGDALLFAPDHDTWHAVEPVQSQRTRLSVTGWWTAP
jgi:hypothetical protein